jgi:uncharacterized protein YlxW (UPF0749 family)
VSAPAPPGARPRRVDGSMSLLVDVMTNTLDEAYAERAARNARGTADTTPSGETSGARRRAAGASAVGVVALVLLGLLTGTAISQVRERAAASAGVRGDLVAEVRDRSAETDQLEQQAAALRAEVSATRDDALGADAAGRAAADAVRRLEVAAGATAVTGPGVMLTVDDAPVDGDVSTTPRLRAGTPAVSRVNDRDLQAIVNGLWAAGAEAVAVNDVRLSSRSAIRSAGEAVLVDFRPLSPPYVVTAVGRPADLEVGFVDSPAGRSLQALAEITGITWSLERRDELLLPAAPEPELRSATPVGAPS